MVIVIEFPFYFYDYLTNPAKNSLGRINWFDMTGAFSNNYSFFKGSSVILFSFTCHLGAFPVYKSLRNNVFTRVEKVFRRSILLDYILYMLVGICGALSVPYYVPEIILNRESLFQNDFFIILSKLGIAFTLIFSIPANYNSFRLSFLEQNNDKTNDLTEKK